MKLRARLDPFPDIPDPSLYVSRDASDDALAKLMECVARPDRPAALLAPPGHGKTLLLHTLAGLLRELTSVYVPNPGLSPPELCAWCLGCVGSPDWDEPIPVFSAYTEHLREKGGALLLLLDDAHGLPEETGRWLGRALARSRGELRLVAAALDGERAKPLETLGPLARIDSLARPMDVCETRAYVEGRLSRCNVEPDLRSRWDEDALQQIQAATGGVPREVSSAVSALLTGI